MEPRPTAADYLGWIRRALELHTAHPNIEHVRNIQALSLDCCALWSTTATQRAAAEGLVAEAIALLPRR